jgi:putative hemolysin
MCATKGTEFERTSSSASSSTTNCKTPNGDMEHALTKGGVALINISQRYDACGLPCIPTHL